VAEFLAGRQFASRLSSRGYAQDTADRHFKLLLIAGFGVIDFLPESWLRPFDESGRLQWPSRQVNS
jgi:hypothetical protein